LHFIIVGIGGIFGSITRYKLGKIISEKYDSTFPTGTFLINISGAFLLGIISNIGLNSNLYYLIGDGFLGAYTTFSTFMYEGFNLFRENEKLNAITYFCITLVLGIVSYAIGTYIIKL
jgi:fluoride exporter